MVFYSVWSVVFLRTFFLLTLVYSDEMNIYFSISVQHRMKHPCCCLLQWGEKERACFRGGRLFSHQVVASQSHSHRPADSLYIIGRALSHACLSESFYLAGVHTLCTCTFQVTHVSDFSTQEEAE